MYVKDEYTAKQLYKAAKKLGFDMLYQEVKKGQKMVFACDFITK
jgi:hypothetical protein